MIIIRFCIIVFLSFSLLSVSGQVFINEVVSANSSGISDEDKDFSDWIELYNSSDQAINLQNYSLSDQFDDAGSWVFPSVVLLPKTYLLVFASGKDKRIYDLKYRTVIKQGDYWQYLANPSASTGTDWRNAGFNAAAWNTGASGFGYGDNDDETIIKPLTSIYLRKEFQIDKLSELKRLVLHVDYDDAFVAFVNNQPVALENLSPLNEEYTLFSVNTDHEAQLFQGNEPAMFDIGLDQVRLSEGTNVLAIQGYNVSEGSTDFTLIPMLTMGSSAYSKNEIPNYIHLSGGELHTNFKVSNEGETVYLFNEKHQLADSMQVQALTANTSYGRFPDGANNFVYYISPTPGTANTNPLSELPNDTVFFSKTAGFYNQTISLNLSSANNETIRYTTNGSEPTSTSTKYTGAFTLTKTSVLRAALFFANGTRGTVYTQTFLINENYTLPVVSLSSDPKNFWDYNEGILVAGPNAQTADPHYGANYWMDWEKPVYLEYFDRNKQQQISQGAGVKVTGGWSRANEQKSLALYARSVYGKGAFNYAFFSDRDFDKYESIILRNAGNDWYKTMLRDGYVSEVVKNLNVDRLAYMPVVILLDGIYWGVINMREKPNEHYFESNYNVPANELNLLEGNGWVVNGNASRYNTMISFLQNRDLSSDADYEKVIEIIDIDCYIDYVLIELFMNNQDWPGNNIKYWNTTNSLSKFRWLLYDTDFGLGLYDSYDYADDAISFATDINDDVWPNPQWSTLLLRRMLTNKNFRDRFINRMADLTNTTFSPPFLREKLNTVSQNIQPEITAHQQKWGRTYNTWYNELKVIYSFIDLRSTYIRNHFVKYFALNKTYALAFFVNDVTAGQIQINSITPDDYPFSGFYFSGVPIKLLAKPKPGYRFVRWEGDINSTNIEMTLNFTSKVSVKAIFEVDESTTLNIVINEINYNSDDIYNSGDWVELYNPNQHTVDLSGWQLSDGKYDKPFVFPHGQVLFPNSYLVVCENEVRFRKIYPGLINRIGDFAFGLGSDGELIQLIDEQGNMIDQVRYESTAPWPVQPFSTSATLELGDPKSDNMLYSNWNAGAEGGSPGRKNGTFSSNYILAQGTTKAYCFPVRFSNFTTLCFNSRTAGEYSVQIVNMLGQVKKSLRGTITEKGTYYLDIFTEPDQYEQGIYLVTVKTGDKAETIKVIKQ